MFETIRRSGDPSAFTGPEPSVAHVKRTNQPQRRRWNIARFTAALTMSLPARCGEQAEGSARHPPRAAFTSLGHRDLFTVRSLPGAPRRRQELDIANHFVVVALRT